MTTFGRQMGMTLMLAGALGIILTITLGLMKPQDTPPPELARTACFVRVVFDGDTIGCDLDANGTIENPAEHVRMLGIDTPEMHYSLRKKRQSW